MSTTGPLAAARVLDLSTMFAGASTAALLADFGADVIKVEHPIKGDPVRGLTTSAEDPAWWEVLNRNKRVVGLLLSDPEGRDILLRLVESGVDVVVDAFRPGVLEGWGLSYDTLADANPGVILTRISGYGQDGPYAPLPAYGTLLESFSGLALAVGRTEDPPVLPPYGLGDHITGLFAAFGTMLALVERGTSGRGQVVDASIYESIAMVMGPQIATSSVTKQAPDRVGNRSSSASPRNTYRCTDGWVSISVATDRLFRRLTTAIGKAHLADDPRFATNASRVASVNQIDAEIEDWTRTRTRAEVVDALADAGAPVGPVNDIVEFIDDGHVRARGSISEVPGPDGRFVAIPGPVPRLARSAGAHWTAGQASGHDTEQILREELGMGHAEIDTLRSRGLVA